MFIRTLTSMCVFFVVASCCCAETLVGVDAVNRLVFFDSGAPGTILNTTQINGLDVGESVVGLDFRPANGSLYALCNTGRLLVVNISTGNSTPLAATVDPLIASVASAFDVNPVPDRIRFINTDNINRRFNPLTGDTIVDGDLAYDVADPNVGIDPNVVACTYTNNVAGSTTTTLYAIDRGLGTLVSLASPNSGVLTTIGALGASTANLTSMDISGTTGTAYACLTPSLALNSSLYTIDLATGTATLVGDLPLGTLLSGLSVLQVPEEVVYGVTFSNELVSFRTNTPGVVATRTSLTGFIGMGDTMVGLDFRSLGQELVGIDNYGQIYVIDPTTAVAYSRAPVGGTVISDEIGFDWNPVPDRYRVVTSAGASYRIVLDTGLLTTDGSLAYTAGDVNEGITPNVASVAYLNSFPGATATTLYAIDATLGVLVIINPPNSGFLSTVGELGVTSTAATTGFDISGRTALAYAMLTKNADPSVLHLIRLGTGLATPVGAVGDGLQLRGMCIAPEGLGFHTVDQDRDDIISLAELLRAIQFYNSLGFYCADYAAATEDGYVPGSGAVLNCASYSSDYAPQDWVVDLSELLRVIQFYNIGGYIYCPGSGTEDNFCPN